MKQTLLLLMVFMISPFVSNRLAAQDAFSSFDVFNRVILVNYADIIDQEVRMEVLALFKGMRKKIDGLEWVHIADLTQSSQDFDQAITVTFKSEAGLEEYESHPDHKRIQELAPGIIKDFASYEYWEKME